MEAHESSAMWSWPTEQAEPEPELTPDDEDLRVHAWRTQQLERLGLSWLVAHAFAPLVDWHEVAALVERGCAPELALEIVR